MIIPLTLVGETLAPWNNAPVFGCGEPPKQRHPALRIEDFASGRRATRVAGTSDVTMVAGAARRVELVRVGLVRVELMRSASAERSPRAATSDSDVRETMVNRGIDRLAEDLVAGSTTRSARRARVTREEAA